MYGVYERGIKWQVLLVSMWGSRCRITKGSRGNMRSIIIKWCFPHFD